MAEYCKPSDEDLAEMKRKDPRLKSTWVIWEMKAKNSKKKTDFDSGTAVASFNTVKGFWKHWNHLPQPSELLEGKKFMRENPEGRAIVECLMLFREGVKPEWEDEANAKGGHFQLQLNHKVGGAQIDEYWNNIVLGMIGGTIEPAEMITGIRLVDKLNTTRNAAIRIEVWFSNFEDTDKVDILQRNLEKCMGTKLDGTLSTASSWGKTDRKTHIVKK